MARRLIKLLRPFETEIWVHDPYLPSELAEALDFILTSLDNVLSKCDVVVCLVPLTPAHEGHVGRARIWLAQTRRGLCQCLAWASGKFAGVDRPAQGRAILWRGWMSLTRNRFRRTTKF